MIFQLGQPEPVPSTMAEDFEKNEHFLRKAHHILFEVIHDSFAVYRLVQLLLKLFLIAFFIFCHR